MYILGYQIKENDIIRCSSVNVSWSSCQSTCNALATPPPPILTRNPYYTSKIPTSSQRFRLYRQYRRERFAWMCRMTVPWLLLCRLRVTVMITPAMEAHTASCNVSRLHSQVPTLWSGEDKAQGRASGCISPGDESVDTVFCTVFSIAFVSSFRW